MVEHPLEERRVGGSSPPPDTMLQVEEPQLLQLINFLSVNDQPEKADALFLFGNYKSLIAEHAAKIFNKGYVSHVLITGFKSDLLEEKEGNEALFYENIMLENGVSESKIIIEEHASNTLENVQMGMKKLHSKGIYPKKLLLCAHATLLRRSQATFKKHYPEIETLCIPHEVPEDFWTEHRIKDMLGEFKRLEKYSNKGDISRVSIPPEIQNILSKIDKITIIPHSNSGK